MKRVIYLIMFLSCVVGVNAQESDLCGTWIGVRRIDDDLTSTTTKTVIKIQKHSNSYTIRVKEINTYKDNSTKTYYWNDCFNINQNGNTLSWNSYSHQAGNWNGERSNGRIISVANYYNVCTATLDNGILHFSYTLLGEFLDRDGNKIGEYHQPPYPELILYKDDPNW